jgi:hypothetical protein
MVFIRKRRGKICIIHEAWKITKKRGKRKEENFEKLFSSFVLFVSFFSLYI